MDGCQKMSSFCLVSRIPSKCPARSQVSCLVPASFSLCSHLCAPSLHDHREEWVYWERCDIVWSTDHRLDEELELRGPGAEPEACRCSTADSHRRPPSSLQDRGAGEGWPLWHLYQHRVRGRVPCPGPPSQAFRNRCLYHSEQVIVTDTQAS